MKRCKPEKNSFKGKIIRYADDEVLLLTGTNLETMILELQEALENLQESYAQMGLKYSAPKCQLLHVTAKHEKLQRMLVLENTKYRL